MKDKQRTMETILTQFKFKLQPNKQPKNEEMELKQRNGTEVEGRKWILVNFIHT